MKQFCKNCIYKTLPSYQKEFASNDIVFLEGEDLNLVYRIESGYIKMHRYLENGDERILSIMGPGEYIALLAVLQNKHTYIASAMTLTETTLFAIDKNDVKKAYLSNDIFKESCLNCAITRTTFFQHQITQSANQNTETKIMEMLRNLNQKFGKIQGDKCYLTLPFSKTVLANLIGIRRETLSRHFTTMQKKSIIQIHKNQYIF